MKRFYKIITVMFLLCTLVYVFSACGAPPAASPSASASEEQSLTLTVEELSAYNGQNGQKAYVAVDGVIYDVTNVPEWKDGKHNGFTAGKDLTAIIKEKSPHGTSKLNGVPIVGKLK